MVQRVVVVLFILIMLGALSLATVTNAQTKKLPVSELSSGFMMEVPPDQSTSVIVGNLASRLVVSGFTCLPIRDLTLTYTHAVMCQVRKDSYEEQVRIGRVEGVGDRGAKVYGRIGVNFTIVFKEKVDLSLFPSELGNLVEMIGGTFEAEKKRSDEKEAIEKKGNPEKPAGGQLTGSALPAERKESGEKDAVEKKGSDERDSAVKKDVPEKTTGDQLTGGTSKRKTREAAEKEGTPEKTRGDQLTEGTSLGEKKDLKDLDEKDSTLMKDNPEKTGGARRR